MDQNDFLCGAGFSFCAGSGPSFDAVLTPCELGGWGCSAYGVLDVVVDELELSRSPLEYETVVVADAETSFACGIVVMVVAGIRSECVTEVGTEAPGSAKFSAEPVIGAEACDMTGAAARVRGVKAGPKLGRRL